MVRRNIKHDELKAFAELILSTDDWGKLKQKMNGTRMGVTNKNIDTPTKKKRLKTLKDLMEAYK